MPSYGITIRGAVQDVGFRELVETLGQVHGLRGFVYNETDGAVRIATQGPRSTVETFVRGIREESERAGIPVHRHLTAGN